MRGPGIAGLAAELVALTRELDRLLSVGRTDEAAAVLAARGTVIERLQGMSLVAASVAERQELERAVHETVALGECQMERLMAMLDEVAAALAAARRAARADNGQSGCVDRHHDVRLERLA
jgi:DNA-binding phage protein